MNDSAWIPFLLQAADPLFPVGSYAHSAALEEIVALGVVRDEATLQNFLQAECLPMLQHLDLVFLRHMMTELCEADTFERFLQLEQDYHLMKLPRELRDAGTAQGRRRLRILSRLQNDPRIGATTKALEEGQFRGQHLAVFGLHAAVVGLPVVAALQAWGYMAFSAAIAAAPKLIRIGEEGCQRVLCSCIASLNEAVTASLETSIEDAGWSSPLLDLASARHEHALVRLFIS